MARVTQSCFLIAPNAVGSALLRGDDDFHAAAGDAWGLLFAVGLHAQAGFWDAVGDQEVDDALGAELGEVVVGGVAAVDIGVAGDGDFCGGAGGDFGGGVFDDG